MGYLKLLKRKLKSFQNFAPAERWLLIQAILLLPLVAMSLRLFGMQRTQKLLARFAIPSFLQTKSPATSGATQIVNLLKVAVRYNNRWATCLVQSLVLCWLLRTNNLPGELKIGVRNQGNKLEAHAWVESEGIVLNDLPDVSLRFSVFSRPIVEVTV